jgi:SRSO17 transposase
MVAAKSAPSTTVPPVLDPERWGLTGDLLDQLGQRVYECWERYRDCFTTRTRDTSPLAEVYLKGLLLLPEERNYANIARRVIGPDDDGQALQQFMSDSPWQDARVFARIQQEIAACPDLRGGALVLDESADARAGSQSAGAARQYLGRLGKVDLGQVGVGLSYVHQGLWTLVDAELYLPAEWFQPDHVALWDQLHIPAHRTFATKPQLGRQLIRQARARGLPFRIVVADAVYGRDSLLRAELDSDGERYVMDVPCDYPVYVQRPIVGIPAPVPGQRGRPRTQPQVLNGVESVRASSVLEQVVWEFVRVRSGERGSIGREAWARRVWTISADWEVREEWLLVHREAGAVIHYSLSNLAADTTVATLVSERCERYWVERTFQDEKTELGWDELVARKYRAWQHHAALTALALWLLMQLRRDCRLAPAAEEQLASELGVEKLPALSVANLRELLQAVLPLRRLTPREARTLVIKHLNQRVRSTRCRLQQEQCQQTKTVEPESS